MRISCWLKTTRHQSPDGSIHIDDGYSIGTNDASAVTGGNGTLTGDASTGAAAPTPQISNTNQASAPNPRMALKTAKPRNLLNGKSKCACKGGSSASTINLTGADLVVVAFGKKELSATKKHRKRKLTLKVAVT